MFVLFSYGAVKHGDGRNHFSGEKNKIKQNKKKAAALLEGVREPSSDHKGK